jgi:hypothetical protein
MVRHPINTVIDMGSAIAHPFRTVKATAEFAYWRPTRMVTSAVINSAASAGFGGLVTRFFKAPLPTPPIPPPSMASVMPLVVGYNSPGFNGIAAGTPIIKMNALGNCKIPKVPVSHVTITGSTAAISTQVFMPTVTAETNIAWYLNHNTSLSAEMAKNICGLFGPETKRFFDIIDNEEFKKQTQAYAQQEYQKESEFTARPR